MRLMLRTVWTLALLLAAGSDPIFNLLPVDAVPAGWQRKGEGRLYAGATLYQHINGGAELYNQYGFDRLAVQDYAQGSHEVRVEIYKMKDEAGASAVFAEITQGMPALTTYGAACTIDDYQVMFLRKAYCVSITSYEPGSSFQAVMASLAAKIDAAITEFSRR